MALEAAQPRLRTATLNNLGCYHRKAGDLDTALRVLSACAREEAAGGGLERCENPAGTLLNLCAVLGALGRHEEVSA